MLLQNFRKLKHLIYKNLVFLFFLPIIGNFLINLISNNFIERIEKFDILNFFSTILLFYILKLIGEISSKTFNLPMVSTGILFYFFGIFFTNNVFIFITRNFSFSTFFIFYNIIFFAYLLTKNKKSNEIIKLFLLVIINFIYNSIFFEKFNLKNFVKGDVEYLWFPMAKNIYNENYYYSLTNPIIEGYTQLISYTQAVVLKINLNLESFTYVKSTTNIFFYLTLLLFFELNMSKKNKILLGATYTSLVINSDWLNYLFLNSLMGEGWVNYFFCVGFVSIFKVLNDNSTTKLTLKVMFLLFGILYFSKQFISLLVVIIILSFLFYKKVRTYAFYSIIPFLFNEINLITTIKSTKRDAYIISFDYFDTINDLLTNTNLKLNNILIITLNLLKDIPVTYLITVFILSFFFYILKTNKYEYEYICAFVVFLINLLLILILYISVWRNQPEMESPIRYILNLFNLVLIYSFIYLEKLEKLLK